MSEFIVLHKDGRPLLVNLDRVEQIHPDPYGATLELGTREVLHVNDSFDTVVSLLSQREAEHTHDHSEPEPCVQCGHMEWEHDPTYDRRFKCRVCANDEELGDCIVNTPEYEYLFQDAQRKWQEHMMNDPEALKDWLEKNGLDMT